MNLEKGYVWQRLIEGTNTKSKVGSFKLVIRLLSALVEVFQLTGNSECKTQSFFGEHCTNISTQSSTGTTNLSGERESET